MSTSAKTKPRCHKCNDTGMVAIRSRDGAYAFAGPVPDDAAGYTDADCWYCDSGSPPGGTTLPRCGQRWPTVEATLAERHGRKPA